MNEETKLIDKLAAHEDIDWDIPNRAGLTPLMQAVSLSSAKTAEALLRVGADPEKEGRHGEVAAHYLAHSESVNEDMMSVLKKYEVPLDEGDDNGLTPLAYAVAKGNAAARDHLLAHGANPNARDINGML